MKTKKSKTVKVTLKIEYTILLISKLHELMAGAYEAGIMEGQLVKPLRKFGDNPVCKQLLRSVGKWPFKTFTLKGRRVTK